MSPLRRAQGVPSLSRDGFRRTVIAAPTSPKPKFFIHGARDELCPLKDMREFYARAAEPKELAVGEVADPIEDLLGDWSG